MVIPTRAELDTLLRDRLASDPDFRAAVLADPRAAISELVGVQIPDLVTVTVHEESLTDVHVVLPAGARSSGEIDEDDLELVAGGVCWANCEAQMCGVGPLINSELEYQNRVGG
ncbi:MAG: hypothetical protein QG597_3735 [Actinomycetota bacterium]|nr:hypothetical protein [Actinomycetota bacterium]